MTDRRKADDVTRYSWNAARLVLALWMLGAAGAAAQTFDSGSDESDGALELTTPGTIDFFDPAAFDPPLDAGGDGVYHFTTVTIAEGVTLVMKSPFRGPVVWLASGDVEIAGIVDLDGEAGHAGTESVRDSIPGAGGYGGGRGDESSFSPLAGNGPGGGGVDSDASGAGGGAGHAGDGVASSNGADGGSAYGNVFLLPLLGGSGGGGARYFGDGGGGGAGGGALLIASSSSVRVDGSISAKGGNGGNSINTFGGGGGGSGGAIRLAAPAIHGTGSIDATAGLGWGNGGGGAPGRIRLETFQSSFSGSATPGAQLSVPGPLSIPADQIPVRVARVDGVDVPLSPTGSFVMPDVVIDSAGEATLEIEARGVPLGTVVQVTMYTEDGTRTVFDSSPLAGTVALSTATASVVVPHGLSRLFAEAVWAP